MGRDREGTDGERLGNKTGSRKGNLWTKEAGVAM